MMQSSRDLVVLVDEQDKPTGTISKKQAHEQALLHWIAVVYVRRPDGQILVQERMSGRLDHSAAGHVDPGESYRKAAERELFEELGIRAEIIEIARGKTTEVDPEKNNRDLRHAYTVFVCTEEPGRLQPSEVKSVFWADPKKIIKEMKHDPGNLKYCGCFKDTLRDYLVWTSKS